MGARRVGIVVVAALVAFVGAGCVADDADPEVLPASDATHPELGPTRLSVMTFNIWLGGGLVDFSKVVETIEQSGADVVGLQEAAGHTDEIAERLGWYAEPRLHIVSRYPIVVPPEGGGEYAYLQLAPGQVVAMSNIHLPSDPYGPELVRDGEPVDVVLQNEQDTRMPSLEPLLPVWRALIERDVPLLLTGDFNSPSHRDWTDESVGSLPHVRYAVEWPVTVAVESVGLVDTFRAVSSASVDPGRTWTYGYPYPRLADDETIDRIDMVFVSEGSDVVDSRVVGQAGTPDVDVEIDRYPADHRAVVSTVVVDPVEPPPFVAVERVRVERGEQLGVRYLTTGGEDTDRIVIAPSGADAGGGAGIMWLPPMEADFVGQVLFGTGNLDPGAYDVVLLGADDVELSRSPFWVVEPGSMPTVTAPVSVAAGEPIELAWDGAPAERFDWLAIYDAGELDLYNGYLAFAYTGATVAGSYTFGPDDLGEEMLPPGEYVAVLASDDHYVVLASAPFTVTG